MTKTCTQKETITIKIVPGQKCRTLKLTNTDIRLGESWLEWQKHAHKKKPLKQIIASRQAFCCNWQIHAHKKKPSQKIILPRQTYILGDSQIHVHKKKPSQNFLFTLSHDLSAPLARNKSQVILDERSQDKKCVPSARWQSLKWTSL